MNVLLGRRNAGMTGEVLNLVDTDPGIGQPGQTSVATGVERHLFIDSSIVPNLREALS